MNKCAHGYIIDSMPCYVCKIDKLEAEIKRFDKDRILFLEQKVYMLSFENERLRNELENYE